MKWQVLAAMALTGATLIGCAETPVQRVDVPLANDPTAYRPQVQPKELPPEGYTYGLPPQLPSGQPMAGGVMPTAGVAQPTGNPQIENEAAFVAAYQKRSPRIMVFVNRTIQGDPLPKDGLDEVLRVETRQTATGAVAVTNTDTNSTNGQSTSAGVYGSSASNNNSNRNNSSSFTSGGPAEYSKTTSVKKAADPVDWVGATPTDYQMIEAAMVQYFDNSGKVRVQDSDAARAKLTREQVLRIENSDPAANRLLAVELQQDVLVRVTAVPTRQASSGQPAIRLIAKAVSTTDARNLGTAFVDMPMPMGKTNINVATRYLSGQLMGQMAQKWAQPPEFDPIEVRIYKAATVDDSLKLRNWMVKAPGVSKVQTQNATGGSTTSYSTFLVGFGGPPEDFYAELKDGIGQSTGLKAVDLTGNTITLEVTGAMNLVTTTRHVDTTTTIETRSTEERRVEPITPAGGGQ
jgi:hypothetical protein